jgi:large subunit ribosomal protein L35
MNKPIYRHLAEKRWRSYHYNIIKQRIEQHHIVPDILPKLDPTIEVDLYVLRKKVQPGQTLDSLVTERAPRLRVQVFEKGERLVSVVCMDPDVPDESADGYIKRCHFLAANIPLSPTVHSIAFSKLRADDQLAVPWLPAFAQKGTDKHRLAIFVLEQPAGQRLDVSKLKELYSARDRFSLKSFRDKFGLRPVGFNMFRTEWDENTTGVMERAGQPGAELEFRRKRVYSLKTPRKAKGWEARRQGPKYRHLWKYTKRIRGLSTAKGWTRKGH